MKIFIVVFGSESYGEFYKDNNLAVLEDRVYSSSNLAEAKAKELNDKLASEIDENNVIRQKRFEADLTRYKLLEASGLLKEWERAPQLHPLEEKPKYPWCWWVKEIETQD